MRNKLPISEPLNDPHRLHGHPLIPQYWGSSVDKQASNALPSILNLLENDALEN